MPEMNGFYFDTADVDYIKATCDKLDKYNLTQYIRGVTTNPNALSKVGCDSIAKLSKLAFDITEALVPIKSNFIKELHFQVPNSHASEDELFWWCEYLQTLAPAHHNDFATVCKIPPYHEILEILNYADETKVPLNFEFNVTGIADAATAARCSTFGAVRYVSIIPGRMEEIGIDADTHLRYMRQMDDSLDFSSGRWYPNVIAGSMRTVDGLKRAISQETIPTIGTRVWDAFTDDDYKAFESWWEVEAPITLGYAADIPLIGDKNVFLTCDFFNQMNTLGITLYADMQKKMTVKV